MAISKGPDQSRTDLIKLPKKSYKKGDLPDTESGWVAHINKNANQALDSRRRYELTWAVNLAYYMGYQSLLFDPKTGILRLPGEINPPLSVNRIGSYVEARHAKLTKQRPVARVFPNTTDAEDRRAAKYSDQSLLYLWRKIQMETQYDKLKMLMLIFGSSFMKSVWDPFSGDILKEDKTSDSGELYLSEDGGIDQEDIWEGEVSSRYLSPFAILPSSDKITEMRDQHWVIEISHLTQIEIETLYPHLRGKLGKSDSDDTLTQYEKMVYHLGSSLFQTTGSSSQDYLSSLTNTHRVLTYWQKPNYQYEKGVLACVVGQNLAMIREWPNNYGLNVYPQTRFVERDNGIHFWGQSSIERLIPIQRAYNRIRQAVDRNAKLMAKGKWMAPKGSQIAQDALDDDSGEIVEYNPAVTEPHQAQMAPLPNYVVEHQQSLIVDFRDAGGQRETSTSPGNNLTAGVAMQMQAELSDESLGPVIRRMGEGMELVANTQLELINQEWLEPRRIKVFGEGNSVGVIWLSQMDLRNHTDVHVEVESMYPEFRGQKRQMLLDFWDRRVVQDPKKLLRAFRYGDFDVLLEEEEKLEDAIILDLQAIKKGKQPEIQPFQNHAEYFRIYSDFAQTPEFLRLEPDRKQLLIQNLQMHLQFLMNSLPGGGAPMTQQNPAAVGTPFGAERPVGAPGANQG